MRSLFSLIVLGSVVIGCGTDGGGGSTTGGNDGGGGSNPLPYVPNGGANASGGANSGAGTTNNGGANTTGGVSANGGAGTQGGNASAGATNGGSVNGGANQGGSGGVPSGAPKGVSVATHDLPVPSGVVFNVADDYFNDGFIPATPVANFGTQSQITAVANDDGSLDIAWLDYTNGKGRPWAVNSPSPVYITHVDAALASATTTNSGVSTYKLLGFAKDGEGAFYLAYNKDHALKSDVDGNPNKLNGNELHVTKLSGGNVAWDQLIFGNQDNGAEDSLGDPGGAASGVLGYDATNQKVIIYVGHSMMWGGVRHQAGFLRLLNPSSGAIIPPSGNDIIHFGAGWWYSHNFNQRLIIDGGNYYVLAHGDAYSRQLGFGRWSLNGYTTKNDTDFNQPYWTISGNEGDNNTNAQTGQFVKMKDGRFLMAHTTSQTRSARDVRLALASGSTGKAEGDGVWLTSNTGTNQATMPKVELLGDYVLATYAVWDSSKKHQLTWYGALLDATLATVVAPQVLPNVEFVDAAPLFRFKGGPNAGQVGWVSGNATHTLSVRVASLAY